MNNNYTIPDAPIIFIDLDHTLINKDSNTIWLEWRIKQRKDYRGIVELLIGLYNSYYYKRGKLTDNKMNTYFWARTLGITGDEYAEMSELFFNEKGIHHIYPESVKLIESLKEENRHIVMITGQDNYLSYPYCRYFDLHDLISNKRIIKNNRFVGFETPNCYSEGKISLAHNYVHNKGYALTDCAFYTDSISDLPLMQRVRYPVAVNPDRELHKKAVEYNWPILNFSL